MDGNNSAPRTGFGHDGGPVHLRRNLERIIGRPTPAMFKISWDFEMFLEIYEPICQSKREPNEQIIHQNGRDNSFRNREGSFRHYLLLLHLGTEFSFRGGRFCLGIDACKGEVGLK